PHQEKNLKRNLNLRPNRLIALNPLVAKQALTIAPNQIVETIPFGIDPTEFTPEGKAITTGLAKPCILLVANLDRHNDQRIELAIEAVARLPQASLLICGEGADRDYFQQLGDRLLGRERCQIRSFAYAQMPQVYRSANLLTSAAEQAPYGLKYVEAMASGLPIVTTDNEISRYLVGSAGIFCDVTNPDEYANSLKRALSRHWYQRQPRQNALRFSWHGITLLYYQAILKTVTANIHQFVLSNLHDSVEN
ncbi:MAG: glycosyltransferase, partial [Cyanobacteria bacterium J06600_6]